MPKIQGTVRLGGKSFVEGDEDALNALGEEMGVSVERAYGVDSTERGKSGRGKVTGAEARSAALARKAERDAEKTGVDADAVLATPVGELEAAIANVSDLGALKRLARRDKRSTAKAIYDARIAAVKAEKEASESDEA